MIADSDLDAVYAAPLSRFVDVRKEIAARLRKEGKKAEATEVLAITKPTPAAWAVNQLAREAREDLERLVPIGAQVRAAMRAAVTRGPSGRKRILAAERELREAVADLVAKARELLESSGATASAAVLERVEVTLTTFSTLGGWRDGVAGRLAKELDPPTVEEVAALLLASGSEPEELKDAGPAETAVATQTVVEAAVDETTAEAARAAREAERQRLVAEANEALAATRAAREGAAALRDRARGALDEARGLLAAARTEEQARLERLQAFERDLAAAKAVVAEACGRVTEAERGLAASESTLKDADDAHDAAIKRAADVSKT